MFIYPSEQALIETAAKWAQQKIDHFTRLIDASKSQQSQIRRRNIEARAAYADMHYLLTHYVIRPSEEANSETIEAALVGEDTIPS